MRSCLAIKLVLFCMWFTLQAIIVHVLINFWRLYVKNTIQESQESNEDDERYKKFT